MNQDTNTNHIEREESLRLQSHDLDGLKVTITKHILTNHKEAQTDTDMPDPTTALTATVTRTMGVNRTVLSAHLPTGLDGARFPPSASL